MTTFLGLLVLAAVAHATSGLLSLAEFRARFGYEDRWCSGKAWCTLGRDEHINNVRKYARIHAYYYYYQSDNIASPALDQFSPFDIDARLLEIRDDSTMDYIETQLALVKAFGSFRDPNFVYISPLEGDAKDAFGTPDENFYAVLPVSFIADTDGSILMESNSYAEMYMEKHPHIAIDNGEYKVKSIAGYESPLDFVISAFPYSKTKIGSLAYSLKKYAGGSIIPLSYASCLDKVSIVYLNGNNEEKELQLDWAILETEEDVPDSEGFKYTEESEPYNEEIVYKGDTLSCKVYTSAMDNNNFPLAYIDLKFSNTNRGVKYSEDIEKCKSKWKNIKRYVFDTRHLPNSLQSPDYYDAIYTGIFASDFAISPSSDMFAFHFEEYAAEDQGGVDARDQARYSSIEIANMFVDPNTRERKSVDPFKNKQFIHTWKAKELMSQSDKDTILVSTFGRVERYPVPDIEEWEAVLGTSINFTSEYNSSRSKKNGIAAVNEENADPNYENTLILVDGSCIKDCAIFVNRIVSKKYAKIISTFTSAFNATLGRMPVSIGGGALSSRLMPINTDSTRYFSLLKNSDMQVGHYIVHTDVLPDTVSVQLSGSSQYGGEFMYFPVEDTKTCRNYCIHAAIEAFNNLNALVFSACQETSKNDKNGIRYAKYKIEQADGTTKYSDCASFDCPNGYGLLDGKCVETTTVVANRGTSIVIFAVVVLGAMLASAVGFGLLAKCLVDRKREKREESVNLI